MADENTIANIRIRHEAEKIVKGQSGPLFALACTVWLVGTILSVMVEYMLPNLAQSPGMASQAEDVGRSLLGLLLSLLPTVLMAPLSLGHLACVQRICRGEAASVVNLGCRRSAWGKAVGVTLLITLMDFLVLLLTALLLSLVMLAVPDFASAPGAVNLVKMPLAIAAMALLLGGVGYVILRNAQAMQLLAAEPERGVRECLRLSGKMMEGRKWQLFRLPMPYVLRCLGVTVAGALVTSLLGLKEGSLALTLLRYGLNMVNLWVLLPGTVACALFFFERRARMPK